MRFLMGLLFASISWGACTNDPRGWCVTGLSTIQDNLLGPLIAYGSDAWIYGDLMEKAAVDTMAVNALAEAPVLGSALAGTVTITSSSQDVATTSDLTGSVSVGDYIAIAWTSVDGAGTGRAICHVDSISSSNIHCSSNNFAPTESGIKAYAMSSTPGASGFTPLLGWAPQSNANQSWNYYDVAIALYRLHYRIGPSDTIYLGYARSYADIGWQWTIDHGYGYPYPRFTSMVSQFFRALDGHTERLPGLYLEVTKMLSSFGGVDQSGFANTDMREAGYALWAAALGAKTDPDTSRHAQYCTWQVTYAGQTNNVQYPDGAFGENDFALNAGYVAAPTSFTLVRFQGAPWRQAINVKSLQAVYESLSDASLQGCNNSGANTALAATTLTVITGAVGWQEQYGRDVVNRGSYYEVNSQSQDQDSVGGTGTASYTVPGTTVTGVGTNWLTDGKCNGNWIIGFTNPRYTYKIASCVSNTSATLTTATGGYGESSVSGSPLGFAPSSTTPCNSSATFCYGPTGDRNLTRTQCGGFGWLYNQTGNPTYLGWTNECLSATLGGPTAGPTNVDTVLGFTLPCSGPACDGFITDTGVGMSSCFSTGGVPPCQNFTQIGNLGKNFGEAFGAPGIDNALAWRLPPAPSGSVGSLLGGKGKVSGKSSVH